jgi:uncharacterized protein (DUF305 family)
MTRTTARVTGHVGALVAGTLLLAGCADDSSDTAHNGPMMGNSDTSDSASDGAEGTFNDTDVAFARDMIPHHQQAIQMARLAERQAQDARVLDLADRIEAAQQPEIEMLSGWLEDWDAETGHMDDGMGGMDGGMSGMMSEQDMHSLMNATGAEFDRLFLEQMIAHHEGAVEMAETEIADGQNADAIALAESIRDSQTAEIAEMEQLLTELGG